MTMNQVDENGWEPIHHAAYRGFIKSVDRFVKANPDSLELETQDDLRSTPLLLAVMNGDPEVVKSIVGLGAKLHVMNQQNSGIVELCAYKHYIDLLKYFIEIDDPKLPVWKRLVKFMGSDSEEDAEAAAKCIHTLTVPTEEGINPNWKVAYDNAVVSTTTKVIKGSIADVSKVAVMEVLLNIVTQPEVQEQIKSTGGIPAIVKHLKSSTSFLVQHSAKCLRLLCVSKEYADLIVQNGALPALVNDLKTIKEPQVIVELLEAIGAICEANAKHQDTFNSTMGSVKAVVDLYEACSDRAVQLSLTNSISKIVRDNITNQNAFVNEGVAARIIPLIRLEGMKHNDLRMAAVEAINRLAHNNNRTQKTILEAGIVRPLLHMLKRSRQTETQEKIAGALWALAGDDSEERRSMAEAVGVQLLVEFLTSQSEELHYIGSEALGVLAQGPNSKQTEIYKNNGVSSCVRLLRSDKEHIVLSIIRTLRYLSVTVGYIPHAQNQTTIAQSRGIKFLVALMVHSRNENIQVEAAFALGAVALGHKENLDEIQQNLDFSYVRILKMMYHPTDMVRLLAGAALASFAYNSLANQKEIADQGGVLFRCFEPFLQSDDEFLRCNAAFQVVVLARIIPDQEQAISSASGIKLLVDLLQDSKSNNIKALVADCIARLAHTRAGVPSAFVSINAINLLCDLLDIPSRQVQGNASVALAFLSYDHAARRQYLGRCRQAPHMMEIMKEYLPGAGIKLHPDFLEGWRHSKQIGLPPIEESKLQMTHRSHYDEGDDLARPNTNGSTTEASSQQFGSGSQHELGSTTRTGSRGSQQTGRHSVNGSLSREHSLNGSQRSLVSQGSQQKLSMPVEVSVEQ